MVYKDLELAIEKFAKSLEEDEDLFWAMIPKSSVSQVRTIVNSTSKQSPTKPGQKVAINTGKRTHTVYKYYYCTCNSFYVRNIGRNRSEPCKHIIAALYLCLKGTKSKTI